jgi:hypothetical protein
MVQTDLAEVLTNAGVEAEIMLVPGKPVAALTAAAERWGADVLVIGRTPKGLSRWLRSDAYGIIRHAASAVVSVDRVAYRSEAVARFTGRMDRPAERHEDELAANSAGER